MNDDCVKNFYSGILTDRPQPSFCEREIANIVKAYVVITDKPDSIVIGIFSTYEKAKEAKDDYMWRVNIYEYEMDKAIGDK